MLITPDGAEGALGVARFAAASTGQRWRRPSSTVFYVELGSALAEPASHAPYWSRPEVVVRVARLWLGRAPRGLRAMVERARAPKDERPREVLTVEERFVQWKRAHDPLSRVQGLTRPGPNGSRRRTCALCEEPIRTWSGVGLNIVSDEAAHVARHEEEALGAEAVGYWLAGCAEGDWSSWRYVVAVRYEHRHAEAP